MKVAKTAEGGTVLFVPAASLGTPEPPTSPVFFNPAASTNRDVSVALVQAAGGGDFCDALAGVGARGIRVAREAARAGVSLVDFNAQALKLARRSAELNGVRCEFFDGEAKAFLHSRFRRSDKFDFVDVDPFGTPAPYIQAAVGATRDGGILSLTATDTAVLCGVYPQVARRRYASSALNNSFGHETGIRILVNAVRRVAASADAAVLPVAAHSTKHYIRVYLRVALGATRADEAMRSEGYVGECVGCGSAWSGGSPERECPVCGKRLRVAGPLWAGGLVEEGVVAKAAAVCGRRGFKEAGRILRSLAGVDGFPPYGYSLDEVCSSLRVPTVPPSAVARELASAGFRSAPQPFEKEGIKTDASRAQLAEAVMRARPSGA